MCKLRRCLANTPRYRLTVIAIVFFCVAVFADYCRDAASRTSTLVLESQTEPGKPQPRIQVEVFSGPATGHREGSLLRRFYSYAREQFTEPDSQWISAHHDVERVRTLQVVASEWINAGENHELRLKPGRYLLAREIWWGREANHAHSGFQYRTIEIKPGERIEIDLRNGWER